MGNDYFSLTQDYLQNIVETGRYGFVERGFEPNPDGSEYISAVQYIINMGKNVNPQMSSVEFQMVQNNNSNNRYNKDVDFFGALFAPSKFFDTLF